MKKENKDKYVVKATFAKNLKKAWKSIGLYKGRGSPIHLAKRYNVTTQTIRDWLNPEKSFPKIETLAEIAQDTGTTIDSLVIAENISEVRVPRCPVLTYELVLDFKNNNLKEGQLDALEKTSLLEGFSADWAVKLMGDSMRDGLCYKEGTLMYFSSNTEKLASGSIVFAVLDNGEFTIRKFIEDAGMFYLMPLNKTYQSYIDNFKILGVFVFAVIV